MTNVLTKQGDKAPNCQGLAWCSNTDAGVLHPKISTKAD
jgi:hypothetical protein